MLWQHPVIDAITFSSLARILWNFGCSRVELGEQCFKYTFVLRSMLDLTVELEGTQQCHSLENWGSL